MNESRCVQLAKIQHDAAGKALLLLADVKAKNLDASSVDLLRIVKVRCGRCAPWSVPECSSVPRSAPYVGVLQYPWSTHGYSAARSSTTQWTGVLHSIVECSAMHLGTLLNSLSILGLP